MVNVYRTDDDEARVFKRIHWIALPTFLPTFNLDYEELQYLHVISCENHLGVRSGKNEWSQSLRFDCLGGLIN